MSDPERLLNGFGTKAYESRIPGQYSWVGLINVGQIMGDSLIITISEASPPGNRVLNFGS